MTDVAKVLDESFADPRRAARAAGLKYVVDSDAGLARKRYRGSFRYTDAAGRLVKDADVLGRIKALVIPPAWENVWICPHDKGHIQAVGYDARGRKQYRYHAQWRTHRDLAKYNHVIHFARKLPDIRRAVRRHLRLPGLPRQKVLAATIAVMEKTLIRVGNEQYAKENHTYGLTTLERRHATIENDKVVFDFRGKHGIRRHVGFKDARLAAVIEECRDLPGRSLFEYLDDDGKVAQIHSNDVNDYLKQVTGSDFTAKDFRTWAGTLLAARALEAMEAASNDRQIKRNIVEAIKQTAAKLGNTVAVCRKCYIHPTVLHSYMDGSLVKTLRKKIDKRLEKHQAGMSEQEESVLQLLRQALNKVGKKSTRKSVTRSAA